MSVFVAIGSAGLLPPVLAAWTPNIIVDRVRGVSDADGEDVTGSRFAVGGS